MLGRFLNVLTKPLIGIGIIDLYQKAKSTELNIEQAKEFATKKQLRDAVRVATKTSASWSTKPSFLERLLRSWLLGDTLGNLEKQLREWRKSLAQADNLFREAKTLEQSDSGNPLEIYNLQKALSAYQSYINIVSEGNFAQIIENLKFEIEKRQKFQKLLKEAETHSSNYFFNDAANIYKELQKLYDKDFVKKALVESEARIQDEEAYLSAFQQAQHACVRGEFQNALRLLPPVLKNFPRPEGMAFLEKIKQIIQGKQKFKEGLKAEQKENLGIAGLLYREALSILPDYKDCKIRIGILALKSQKWQQVLQSLEGLEGEQVNYLRGFAYAELKNFKEANREWRAIKNPKVQEQRQVFQQIMQMERLLTIQTIQESVDRNTLEQARLLSETHLKSNPSDTLVQNNLNNHILPRLSAETWQNPDWSFILSRVRQDCIDDFSLNTLHNYAVASYYLALEKPTDKQNINIVIAAIASTSSVLANVKSDPSLKNVPWLAGESVDYDFISKSLQKNLDVIVDKFKDIDLDSYIKLRDVYRLEQTTLDFIAKSTKVLQIKGLFVTPFYYRFLKDIQPNINFPVNIWGTLYTSWGLAVAACLSADIPRAIKIKPSSTNGEVEVFAKRFICFHEGCYHLQNKDWNKSKFPLNEIKSIIKNHADWQTEIDKSCKIQRKEISEFDEHLQFAQFWYDLLGSQESKTYLAEYRARQIVINLDKKKVSRDKSLQQLSEVLKIDSKNATTIDLIETIEIQIELEEIDRLLKQKDFDRLIANAKYSKHQKVKFIVADFFINILIEESKKYSRNIEIMAQLGKWAYSVAPNEPAFQEVYRSLRSIGIRLY